MTAQPRLAPVPSPAAPHGPGTPATLRPGERGSVLVLSPPAPAEDAMGHAVAWMAAFEEDCGLVLDRDATALYAVALLGDLRHDAAGAGAIAAHLDFVLADGVWHHRGTCPTRPGEEPEQAWARLVGALQDAAGPQTLGTVWDVHPLPTA